LHRTRVCRVTDRRTAYSENRPPRIKTKKKLHRWQIARRICAKMQWHMANQ